MTGRSALGRPAFYVMGNRGCENCFRENALQKMIVSKSRVAYNAFISGKNTLSGQRGVCALVH